jgi:hypothetical protein
MENDDLQEPFGASTLIKMQRSLSEDAKSSYDKLLNRLWAGNAGGAVTTLTALHQPTQLIYLVPLVFFVFGLLLLGIGAFYSLHWIRRDLRNIEGAQEHGGSILHLKAGYALSV